MSVNIHAKYIGNLHVLGWHGPSGVSITSEAPLDNHGTGGNYSPTDLVAAGFAHGMLTIMGIHAKKHGIDIEGSTVSISKHMSKEPPRRIVSLPMTITMRGSFTDEEKALLVKASEGCPVIPTIHPDITYPITWVWED